MKEKVSGGVNQCKSIALCPRQQKYALYESITEDNLENYHRISCRPITKVVEDDMELVSDIVTWGERYLHCFKPGLYVCSRCRLPLYSSADKYPGPCRWPSFRECISTQNIAYSRVCQYNGYTVAVDEIYCNGCELFIGHRFEDAREKGDSHPNAHWRH